MSDIKTGKSRELQFAPRSEMRELRQQQTASFIAAQKSWGRLSNNTSSPWVRTPRRLAGDHSENLMWAADFLGQDIASVDIRTLKVNYYDLPVPYASAYDVEVDKNHIVWASLRTQIELAGSIRQQRDGLCISCRPWAPNAAILR